MTHVDNPVTAAEASSASPARPLHSSRLTPLDGFRGAGCCSVLIFHFTPDYWMANRAWEWVFNLVSITATSIDSFFVLSGMLITDILLRSRGTPHAARNFYARRFLRIWPLYYVLLTFAFLILPRFVPPGADPNFDIIQSTQAWYWAYCDNLLTFLYGFTPMTSATISLAHVWSLAVEEHFYLVWPLLIWSWSDRRLLWVTLALVLAGPCLRMTCMLTLHSTAQPFANLLTPMRMDELALGAVLALLFQRANTAWLRKTALVILPIALTILAGAFVWYEGLWDNTFLFGLGISVCIFIYASVIVLLRTSSPASLGVRIFDSRFLRFFGKYSYGIYVIHGAAMPWLERWLPAEGFLAVFQSPPLAAVACVATKSALSIAAALISWKVLEGPCLSLKRFFETQPRRAAAIPAPEAV